MDNLIYVVLFLILVAEFVDGWTDAPNAVATVISTRTLSPLTAVLMATLFNLLGVFAGTAVATTIGTEIINANVVNMTTIASSMIAVIIWCSLAAFLASRQVRLMPLSQVLEGPALPQRDLMFLFGLDGKKS